MKNINTTEIIQRLNNAKSLERLTKETSLASSEHSALTLQKCYELKAKILEEIRATLK